MSITVDELFAMNPETYQIVDIRGEQEVARGAIDGALHLDKDEISASPEVDKTKNLLFVAAEARPVSVLRKNFVKKDLMP